MHKHLFTHARLNTYFSAQPLSPQKAHLHWQKPKYKKPGFFVATFTLPEKPITFRVFGKKSACAKKPESHTGFFGTWCDFSLRSTSRAAYESPEGHVPRDQKPK